PPQFGGLGSPPCFVASSMFPAAEKGNEPTTVAAPKSSLPGAARAVVGTNTLPQIKAASRAPRSDRPPPLDTMRTTVRAVENCGNSYFGLFPVESALSGQGVIGGRAASAQ
ncbi:MAG: hypothetical protein ACRDJP_14105, partial [Actinomycetota bacterium]